MRDEPFSAKHPLCCWGGTYNTCYKLPRSIAQIKNPKSGEYTLVDRDKGLILGRSPEPYKGVPIAGGEERE